MAEVSRFKDCNTIGRCFGMSTGTNSWHVDGHHHFGTSTDTLLAGQWSTETIFFGMSSGTSFCMSMETILFGMSTGATLLACRRSFWHVDASYPGMYMYMYIYI